VCAHEAVDLAEKVRRAAQYRGPKLLLSLAVCPPGWGYDPALGDEIARLAVKTGI
jgi:pyruvate ferredoxin oxidoreductase beta subunit